VITEATPTTLLASWWGCAIGLSPL